MAEVIAALEACHVAPPSAVPFAAVHEALPAGPADGLGQRTEPGRWAETRSLHGAEVSTSFEHTPSGSSADTRPLPFASAPGPVAGRFPL